MRVVGRYGYGWPRYVPVAERRFKAKRKVDALRKKGMDIQPIIIEGRKIAFTFWGKGWCSHLEAFSDFANRLPRGRSYVRNGAVCHLSINEGGIEAMVIGSELYKVQISIEKLPDEKWQQLKKHCAGQIGSMLELLQGKLSKNIMSVVADRTNGLFPLPGEIGFSCDCPDWADMCKHVAAVLYGAGRRLDEKPELLFLLRGVNVDELITEGAREALSAAASGESKSGKTRRVSERHLEDIFGIDLGSESVGGDRATVQEIVGWDHLQGPSKSRRQKKESSKTASPPVKKPAISKKEKELKEKIRTGAMTGPAIAGMRADFGMTQCRFALLLGVSVATVCNWERNEGTLKLQDRSRRALFRAAKKYT